MFNELLKGKRLICHLTTVPSSGKMCNYMDLLYMNSLKLIISTILVKSPLSPQTSMSVCREAIIVELALSV